MSEFLRNSDAFAWSIESDPRLRSTIVSVILLDRAPDWRCVVERFDRLSQAVPMFRQRVVESMTPLPPHWEDDPDFDLAFHVRRVTAPEPHTLDALLEMARIAAMADFDRARPLWEVTLVDGLADGGAGLLCKVHHALTDGLGAVQLATVLFDHPGAGGVAPTAPASQAADSTAGIRNAITYGVGHAGASLSALLINGIRNPVGTVRTAYSAVASIARTARPLTRPGSPIIKRRSRIRHLAAHCVAQGALQEAGRVAGGSLNDAFIAAVVGGLRRYHEKHGAPVGDLTITMPINLRTADDPVAGNRVTLIRFAVPAGVADPAQRIAEIHECTGRARNEKSLGFTQLIAGVLNLVPRWYVGSAFRNVDLLISDVPGFPKPVSFGGAAVRMQYAFAPTLGAAVNVTLLSYAQTCAIGINVDQGAIPDVDVFYDCLVAGFDEVLALSA